MHKPTAIIFHNNTAPATGRYSIIASDGQQENTSSSLSAGGWLQLVIAFNIHSPNQKQTSTA